MADLLHARQVEAMAGFGISPDDIATVLGISRMELDQDYRKELDTRETSVTEVRISHEEALKLLA